MFELKRFRGDERGAVLVVIAIALPVFIGLATIVLDVGNWYAHKRSEQSRVDAAAFAASVAYGYNFPSCAFSPGGNNAATQILTVAKQYAGNGPAQTYNGSNNDGTDIQVNPPGETSPCPPTGTMSTDVHGSTNPPSLFGGFGVIPTIKARARVALMQMQTATGIQPFAVANPGSTECATLRFYDGSTVVHTAPLNRSNNQWSAPVSFSMPSGDVHTDLTLGGDCSNGGQSIIYSNVGYLQSYKSSDSFQSIQLYPSGACDAAFVPRNHGNCQFDILVLVHTEGALAVNTVTAHIGGSTLTLCSTDQPLPGGGWPSDSLFASNQSSSDGSCTGSGPATVQPGDGHASGGVLPVMVEATTLDTSGPTPPYPAGPDLGPTQVQAVMAGDDTQVGPIADVHLDLNGGSYSFGNTQQVDGTVTVTIEPLVNGGACAYFACNPAANPPDPALDGGPEVVLRGGTTDVHTQNGPVDCPPTNDSNVADYGKNGCRAPYQLAATGSCTVASPPDCAVGSADSQALTNSYQRFWTVSGSCSQSNWPGPANLDQIPLIPRGDPRLITVVITKMGGSFGPGDQHPIVSYAAFYVTGGTDAPSGCGTPRPHGQATAQTPGGHEIWGHFLKFAEASSTGGPGAQPCVVPPNSEDIAACIATLVQ